MRPDNPAKDRILWETVSRLPHANQPVRSREDVIVGQQDQVSFDVIERGVQSGILAGSLFVEVRERQSIGE
jgi:hypothetical protein